MGRALFAQARGIIHINLEPDEPVASVEPSRRTRPTTVTDPQRRKRSGANARTGDRDNKEQRRYSGDALSGDDLGDPELRNLNADKPAVKSNCSAVRSNAGSTACFPR